MLPAPHTRISPRRDTSPARRRFRRRLAWVSVLATVVAGLTGAAAAPVAAAQASGDDVATWSTGWSWTYQTTFRYVGDTANVTLNESVTYTVAGVETFQGQSAYRLNISGTITGGSGTADVDGIGTANLNNFAGSVSGTKLVRRSDLALLQESQQQSLTARASLGFLSTNISANINLRMTPKRGWRALAFPLDAGQSWTNDVDVDYDGGFSYDAGSFGNGADDFDGTFSFDGPSTVSNATIGVPAGSVATRRVHAQSPDGRTVNTHWWAPSHRNDAQELLQLPLDGATLTLDRRLSASSTPAPGTVLTSTVTPSLSCAGGQVTVSGRLSTGAAGVPVTVVLDKSPVTVGQSVTASTSTVGGGSFSTTLVAPAEEDGLDKTGARASWGVVVTAAGASSASTLVVTPRNCSALTYDGATSAPQGSTATVRATLADRAGGSVSGRTVTFTLSGGATVTATTSATGVASAQIAVGGPPREATLTASYAGSAGLEPASTSVPFTVGTVPSTTAVTVDPPVVTVGAPVRFTATVGADHAGTPSGTVQFRVDGFDFGAPVALVDGAATSPALSTLPLGTHTVTAAYSGSADHSPSTSPAVGFRVREPLLATTTTASASPASAVAGQPVTLSASVTAASGSPQGDVVFTVDGDEVGRAALTDAGTASVEVDDLPVGSNSVVATYLGDDVHGSSAAAPRTVTVEKAAVTVELAGPATSTVSGEAVTYTATVAVRAPGGGVPEGTVQLLVGGAEVGEPVALAGGTATFPPLTTLGAGSHTVEARYAGSARHLAGSAQAEQQVEQATTTTTVVASPSPSVEDQNVELVASVVADHPGSGSPTGTVTFYAGDEVLGSAPLSGSEAGTTARLETADLAPGSYQLTARYAGDADYRPSRSAATSHTVLEGQAVVATTTELTSSANPSSYGAAVTFRARVSATDGTASGTVQFSVDGQDLGDPVAVDADGVAVSPALDSAAAGDHAVIASFVGAPGFSGSGALLTQTVDAATPAVELTSTAPEAEAGQPVRFTASVASTGSGTPTGFVQFAVDGRPLGAAVALSDGAATSPPVDDLAPGEHTVTALYSGDANFRTRLAELTQRVVLLETATTLTVDPDRSVYGDPVTLAATVTPARDHRGSPGGTVRFEYGDTVIARATLAPGADGTAVATATVSSLPAGSHDVRAVYEGSPVFRGSASAAHAVVVAKRPTVITASPAVVSLDSSPLPLGQLQATLTAGGRPLAGAPVEFKIGARVACVSVTNQSGLASCNAGGQLLSLLVAGGYTATFAGDANHLSSSARGALLK
ncbi:Ig-like domain repeat protein [Nocardioides sp. SYSU DS0651]|uniref:Ig-like domain repeat protein n=1 Tax=Nocardioides sp. SYSU DS0651 TaxID=3415955 RepID=UPI003F4C8C7C